MSGALRADWCFQYTVVEVAKAAQDRAALLAEQADWTDEHVEPLHAELARLQKVAGQLSGEDAIQEQRDNARQQAAVTSQIQEAQGAEAAYNELQIFIYALGLEAKRNPKRILDLAVFDVHFFDFAHLRDSRATRRAKTPAKTPARKKPQGA